MCGARHACRVLLIAAVVSVCGGAAQAQPPGQNRIRVSVAPSLVNFTLVRSGVSSGSAPLTIDTNYRVPAGNQVTLYAYFVNPAQALDNGSPGPGNVIPSAQVAGSVNGGAFQPFVGAGPFSSGSSLLIYTEVSMGGGPPRRRTDALSLQIDTTGLNLRAGTYTGTLRLQAQVI
jgi:hypothetical protein